MHCCCSHIDFQYSFHSLFPSYLLTVCSVYSKMLIIYGLLPHYLMSHVRIIHSNHLNVSWLHNSTLVFLYIFRRNRAQRLVVCIAHGFFSSLLILFNFFLFFCLFATYLSIESNIRHNLNVNKWIKLKQEINECVINKYAVNIILFIECNGMNDGKRVYQTNDKTLCGQAIISK